MDFAYRRSFERSGGDAYENLLIDCMLGDPTYFIRADEVERAWELIDGIEAGWADGSPPLAGYPAGSWGPAEADAMLAREGRRWYNPAPGAQGPYRVDRCPDGEVI
jgi:glucose-6-phosphate 1-dehydrogenase